MGDRVLQRVEAGAGRPGVVLEAGRNDVAASWQPVMTLLAPHVHVVACDRAGLPVRPSVQESLIRRAAGAPLRRRGALRPGRVEAFGPVRRDYQHSRLR